MNVKLSRYAIIVQEREFAIFYNSLFGSDSLCKIRINNFKDLLEALIAKKSVEYKEDYLELLSHKILVDSSFDEENYREFKKNINLYDSGTNLIIMPTEQCNFRCTYCYENFKKGKMSQRTIDDIKGYILRNANKFKFLNIDWFGGEPLCAYDIVTDIMEYSKQVGRKVGIPILSTMTTNGYLLSPDVLKNLARLNVVGYQITIDGIKNIHNGQRKLCGGGGTFDKIIDNLIRIKKEVNTGTIKICIRVNLNSISIKYADQLFDLMKEHFESDNRFSLSLRYVRDLRGDGKTTDIIEDDIQMLEVYEKAASRIPRLLSSHFMNMLESSGICYAGKPHSIVVGSDGLLYKCTVHFSDHQNLVGKLENKRMILSDEKMSSWIQQKRKKSCADCWYSGACYDGTCPYVSIDNPEKISCPFEKIHISYILRFLDTVKLIKEICNHE